MGVTRTLYKYGIDFGTTNSSIALHYDADGKGILDTIVFDVDQNLISRSLLPSLVYIDVTGNASVGTRGKNEFRSPELDASLKKLIRKVKLSLDETKNDVEIARMGSTTYKISDVIGLLLKELKKKADRYHNISTDGFVFGVPVEYNDACKLVMLEATVKAGFYNTIDDAKKSVEFLSEPVSVALDYGLNLNEDKTVFVFDFGGGTLDLAIVQLHSTNDNSGTHEVIAKKRLTLGGEKYTELFFKKAILQKVGRMELLRQFRYDRFLDPDEIWNRLQADPMGSEFIDRIEQAKCELSYEPDVIFSFVSSDLKRNINITQKLAREDFEQSIEDSMLDIYDAIEDCLGEIDLSADSIDEVLMAGGSSLIPAVIKEVRRAFGDDKVRDPNKNALTSIVKGLAIKGYEVNEHEWVEDITESDYGIWIEETQTVNVVVKRNTPIKETTTDKSDIEKGCYIDVKSIDDDLPRIQVYQNDTNIGEFRLPVRGSGHYRIYYEIDKNKGILTVQVFDRRNMQWYNDLLRHNKLSIQNV